MLAEFCGGGVVVVVTVPSGLVVMVVVEPSALMTVTVPGVVDDAPDADEEELPSVALAVPLPSSP